MAELRNHSNAERMSQERLAEIREHMKKPFVEELLAELDATYEDVRALGIAAKHVLIFAGVIGDDGTAPSTYWQLYDEVSAALRRAEDYDVEFTNQEIPQEPETLPTPGAVRGIMPNLTGGKSPERYVKERWRFRPGRPSIR